jgi:hypothetical protein
MSVVSVGVEILPTIGSESSNPFTRGNPDYPNNPLIAGSTNLKALPFTTPVSPSSRKSVTLTSNCGFTVTSDCGSGALLPIAEKNIYQLYHVRFAILFERINQGVGDREL